MTATTTSRIVWPRPATAGCIFCMIVRDTRGVRLDQAQRFNFFPASPLCCVSWLLAGDWHLIDGLEQMEQPWTGTRLPPFAVSGAQLRPLVSWNPGGTFAVSIAFYPDAFSAMTGLDLAPLTGRMVAADEALPQPMLEICQNFLDAVQHTSIEDGLSALERNIEIMWSRARPAEATPIRWLKDWTRSVVLRAALSGPGRSTRQISRRIKSSTGVSERDLQSLGHTEQLYAKLHEATQKGVVDWANLAASTGFADQAHMIRRLRQHTGFTPSQLRSRAASDEALWAYRLLGQYFSLEG